MPAMTVVLTEPAWPDLNDKEFMHVAETGKIEVTAIANGMSSGAPSVAFRIESEDGQIVVAETSLMLLLSVTDALKARFGDPREEQP